LTATAEKKRMDGLRKDLDRALRGDDLPRCLSLIDQIASLCAEARPPPDIAAPVDAHQGDATEPPLGEDPLLPPPEDDLP